MKKLETIWWSFVLLAAVGVVLFWYFGWNGNQTGAVWSISVAGVLAWFALGAKGLYVLRERNGGFD